MIGILLGLALLISLAYRGWSVLLLTPAAALVAGEPLLAHWTQTFMTGAARFLAHFFRFFCSERHPGGRASLVGFGSVVAALPAFDMVRDWVLGIEGGPLVSLAVSTNVLAALTGSASGGLTIALEALGSAYVQLAGELGIDPALMHRVAVIGAGTLDSFPHNGAVVTLLAVCGTTHRESYLDIVMVAIVGAVIALAAIITPGTLFGSFRSDGLATGQLEYRRDRSSIKG